MKKSTSERCAFHSGHKFEVSIGDVAANIAVVEFCCAKKKGHVTDGQLRPGTRGVLCVQEWIHQAVVRQHN